MHNTQVRDLMSFGPAFISANDDLAKAAALMRKIDCGVLPVGDSETVEGMITDRDIVIRAIAMGKNPAQEKVKDYMTSKVYACHEDDYLEDAADKMREHKVSRLIVRDSHGHTKGILSFGGILRKIASADEVANVVKHAMHKIA